MRDILVGFGAAGRESVQQLMNAPNWEVRRTAAYPAPRIRRLRGTARAAAAADRQRAAGSARSDPGARAERQRAAAQILLQALKTTSGRPRQTLISELTSMRDERAGPLFCHLSAHARPTRISRAFTSARSRRSDRSEDLMRSSALKDALQQGDWWRHCGRDGPAPPRRGRCGESATPRPSKRCARRRPAVRAAFAPRPRRNSDRLDDMANTSRAPRSTRSCCDAWHRACARRSSMRRTIRWSPATWKG